MDVSGVVVQQDFNYGSHELQNLSVYHPVNQEEHNEEGYFLIYIHGGAWRDPTIHPASILPSIKHLFTSPSHTALLKRNIRAIASLSYRLSPHPNYPQDPTTTLVSQLRNAKHPDHLTDIVDGIAFLQKRFGFAQNYMLVGHSCGATLALQSLILHEYMPSKWNEDFTPPEVVVGVAGIYDLRLLRDNNSHPAYQEFLAGAFGDDELMWDLASPALTPFPPWKGGKIIVLVTSTGDELVDPSQFDAMAKTLEKYEYNKGATCIEVWKGWVDMSHDEIWKQGVGLGEIIGRTLREFFGEGEGSS